VARILYPSQKGVLPISSAEYNLVLFDNPAFQNVRIIQFHGKPWFAGKDVCLLFGDTNHNRSLSRIDDDEKMIFAIDTKGGKQKMTFVNEFGLYNLLLGMQPKKANKNGVQYAYPLMFRSVLKH